MAKDQETVRNRASERTVLQHVLMNGEFGIAYQPIVDLVDGSTFGREALLRPTSGFPTPLDMLRVAVAERRMGELGRQLRRLATRGAPNTRLFLNAYPEELDPRTLATDDSIFAHAGGVYLEMAPRNDGGEMVVPLGMLEALRNRGICLAFEDFGGPRSHLRDLFELGPNVVKLDPEVAQIAAASARGLRYLSGIVRLALDLGAAVIAKGIESQRDLDVVRAAGVRYAQGNHIAAPSQIESIELRPG